MDKNQKKNIAIAGAAGVTAGIIGEEAARIVEEKLNNEEAPIEDNPQPSPTGGQTNQGNQAPTPPANAPTQQNQDYSGITEVVPVDTGGGSTDGTETAEVVVDVPQEELIAGVDDVNIDDVAEAIIMEPEIIIEDGLDMASIHAQEPQVIEEEELIDEDPGLEDDEDLAESDEESEDEGEIIDDIV